MIEVFPTIPYQIRIWIINVDRSKLNISMSFSAMRLKLDIGKYWASRRYVRFSYLRGILRHSFTTVLSSYAACVFHENKGNDYMNDVFC
jgi:hypothetical protein